MAENREIYVVPHSHIDTEWYWTYEETVKRSVAIVEAALEVMRKRDDFTFAQDQVTILKPALDYMDGEDKEYLLKMIGEGRFEVVGGMWVQPDVQVPHGEVFIRNILHGRRWMAENLGAEVEHAWNLDVFGQCPQIPQILSKSNFKSYTFMRGVPEKMTAELPNLFYWQSPDGSKILTHWMSMGYGHRISQKLFTKSVRLQNRLFYKYLDPFPVGIDEIDPSSMVEAIKESKENLDKRLDKSPGDFALIPLGTDNSIAREDLLEVLDTLNNELEGYNFFFSTPSKFFDVAAKTPNISTFDYDFPLPLRVQDLRGTFEGRCELKKAQREFENNLLAAEKFSSIALQLGYKYPSSKMKLAWDDVMMNSFHDTIGGSHSDDVYREAMLRYGKRHETGDINDTARLALDYALTNIAGEVATKENVKPIIVFNSLSWEMDDVCYLEVADNLSIEDEDGVAVPQQKVGDRKIAFKAQGVPSMGYKAYYVSTEKLGGQGSSSLKADSGGMENDWWRIEFDPASGGIKSLWDKKGEREILDTSDGLGNELVAYSSDGDLEGMLEIGEDVWVSGDFKAQEPSVEVGDLFAKVTFPGDFEVGKREQSVILYNDSNRIDFETKVDIVKDKFLLMTRFPLALKDFKIIYETPYAPVQRFEENLAAQNWVACQGENGIALLNSGNPGYWVQGNRLQMALLWSVDQTWAGDTYHAPLGKELGEHEFRYSLYPYQGDWGGAKVVQRGAELNNPLIPLEGGHKGGSLPSMNSFVGVEADNFIISTMKKAEDSSELVLRGYETEGRDSQVEVSFGFPIKRAWMANLVEEKGDELEVSKNRVSFPCGKFEILTLILQR